MDDNDFVKKGCRLLKVVRASFCGEGFDSEMIFFCFESVDSEIPWLLDVLAMWTSVKSSLLTATMV